LTLGGYLDALDLLAFLGRELPVVPRQILPFLVRRSPLPICITSLIQISFQLKRPSYHGQGCGAKWEVSYLFSPVDNAPLFS
jgi:hypothetical protein